MKILYLVHDVGDAAVAKRTAMLRAGGAEVTVAGFRRNASDVAAIDLGQTHNGRFLQRIMAVVKIVLTLRRDRFGDVDLIMARNLEMLAIGVRARSLKHSKPVLVYESLDIHRLLLNRGPVGGVLRALEGWLSRRASALITSSPAFVAEYFEPLSKVRLPIRLVENKVYFPLPHGRGREAYGAAISRTGEGVPQRDSPPQPTPSPDFLSLSAKEIASPMRERESAWSASGLDNTARPVAPPWRIGWFGAIRCRESLALLTDLVRSSAGRVEVIIRGRPAYDQFDDFTAATTGIPGLKFIGPYANPQDLAEIYGEVHFTWAIDRFEAGQNSAWLLPNRLYEGGALTSVAIAEKAVETGRFLDRLGIGVTLQKPSVITLSNFFAGLTPEAYEKLREAAAAIDAKTWIDDEADCVALVAWLQSLQAAP